ncbi:F0F1 ATP synthase subunit epsilon [Rarobacter incanus]|uniref:ATP synthase epsilon chain n=1 Tax=Rarobacter incanus TaxID=153494 RepID=A0A542SRI1_9MICO|nr:F0F1 ATP synthase subunit epsilon [Rarobacter incanus]TQK77204.1 ATP synthase F1 subcomplex epsilon subunit [Rarobacter incanus]
MAQLEVNVVATGDTLWQGQARMVVAPASDGEVGILAGHTPMLAVLKAGTVRVVPITGEKVAIHVTGGFLSVDSDVITVVADSATIDASAH